MNRNRLLLFPLVLGIALMAFSWYLSYPLSIDFVGDYVFNHVSVFYWFSVPLILTSMFMLAATSKNNYVKWVISVGIVLTIYSQSYFYYMLPGSDSHYFRGLTEYFIKTKNLDPSGLNHWYLQWPSFFILNSVATSVSGLGSANFEFLLYAIIGFLMATALHVYASRVYERGGSVAIAAFFVAMFYFWNYQAVPFSLAFGLLCILFMLETRKRSLGVTATTLVLFTGIAFTHAFVPLFFVAYLLVRYLLRREHQYARLFLVTLTVYLVEQFTLGQYSFASNILTVMKSTSEYSRVVGATLASISVSLDVTAQMFSRITTVAAVAVCFVGFILLWIKRKARHVDKAVFLAGAAYSIVGIFLFTLGTRAISLAFIPIALGAAYLSESRLRPYLICFFLILLSLFAFIPIHISFIDSPIAFQTKEAYATARFVIEKTDWNAYGTMLASAVEGPYIFTQVLGNYSSENEYSESLSSSNIGAYDTIIYSVSLAKSLQAHNISEELILSKYDVIFDSHFSFIAQKGV